MFLIIILIIKFGGYLLYKNLCTAIILIQRKADTSIPYFGMHPINAEILLSQKIMKNSLQQSTI